MSVLCLRLTDYGRQEDHILPALPYSLATALAMLTLMAQIFIDVNKHINLCCFAGADLAQLRHIASTGQLPEEPLRFFAGEAMWTSQQLEAELAEGKWMLLTPNADLLQRVSMHPQSFNPE